MTLTLSEIESLSLKVEQEIRVKAPLDVTFEALLEQLGPGNEMPDGTPMKLKLESWPGGRWFRDLGNDNGHFWGHVKAIQRPTLLEIVGPLFASYPFASNVQYRLSEADGGTLIKFHHQALGFITEEHRGGVVLGWTALLDRVRAAAEKR